MNKNRFQAILDKIKANPACWHQQAWHHPCGTAHCFAGHAQIDAGCKIDDATVRQDARIWLDLSLNDANYLFAARRTLDDFEAFAIGRHNRDDYTRDSYNRDGYDSDGLDKHNKPSRFV